MPRLSTPQMMDYVMLGHLVVDSRSPDYLEMVRSTDRVARVRRPSTVKLREIEDGLVDYLNEQWADTSQVATDEVIRAIVNGRGDLSADEIQQAMDYLSAELGPRFGTQTAASVRVALSAAYDVGRKHLIKKPVFNLVDSQAKAFLAEHHSTFWIGDHYGNAVGPRIADTVRQTVIEQGLGRTEAGNALAEIFTKDLGPKSESYWRLVAANATTKARNYGTTESLVQGDFEDLEVVAMMDERTSLVCRTLNGMVFKTEWAVAQRNKVMAAKTAEEAKFASRWLTPKDVIGRTAHDLYLSGVCLPPYHGNCRTLIVAK